jgi:2-phospho-L-lactate guanylyltransferase
MPLVQVPTWAVVVPVKRLADAKSRLRGALPGVPHPELALALVLDTLAAALECPVVAEVLVVTDDAEVGFRAGALGVRVVPDVPGTGLNPALRHGAALAVRHPVAALAGDLPALRSGELAEALTSARVRAFVSDAAGTGTTLLAAPRGVPLDPWFGAGSALAHARSGAVPLTGAWPSLRQDVDTAADLHATTGLGMGAHTAALLAPA